MFDKNAIDLLENRISDVKKILYDLQVFIKLGALACDSCITDDELQLDKNNDDYYLLFKTLNDKLQKGIEILDFNFPQKD